MDVRRHVDVVTWRWPVLLLVALLLAPRSVGAQELPKLSAPVNDLADVIDAASETAIDERIRALHAATGDTIVVATVPTFAPYGSIEEYAVRLFERAGIGDAELDRGLLVLLALDERRVRIEVGYGLEEVINDGYAGDVIRRQMLPAFRQDAYGEGLLAAVTTLARRIGEYRGVDVEGLPPAPAAPAPGGPSLAQIIFIIVLLIVIAGIASRGGGSSVGRRRRRRGGWHGGLGGFGGGFGGFGGGLGGSFGGGHSGGGFGGFGGGMSGGGGASGRW